MSTFYNAWENWNTWFNFHPSSNPNNRIIEKVCNCRFISKVDFNTFVECNFTSPAQWLINIIFYLPCNEIFLLTSFCTMNILILDTLTHSLAHSFCGPQAGNTKIENVTYLISFDTLVASSDMCLCPNWYWGFRENSERTVELYRVRTAVRVRRPGPGKQWTGNCLASHHWEWKPNCWVTSY